MSQAGSRAAPARGRELRARGQRTMARLLEAGATVFAERGYHAARVDDIVKAAKTSHGTFYLYFSSKEDLFRAIAESIAAEMLSLARRLPAFDGAGSNDVTRDGTSAGTRDRDGAGAGDTASTDGQFRVWLGEFSELYSRHGKFLRTWTDAEIGDGDLGRIARDLVTEFSRQLARRVRTAAPDLDPSMTAFALVSMIERTSYYVESRQLRIPTDQALDVLARVTHDALHGRAAAT